MKSCRIHRLVAVLALALSGTVVSPAVQSVALASAPAATRQSPRPAPKIYQFTHGQWFDGKRFVAQTFYTVHGLLTHKKPSHIDETVDLKSGFVVPPYGDAHCHHFDGAYNVAQQTQMYLQNGIFYVKVLCNSRLGAQAVARQVNVPTGVDVCYAHGGLTGDNSHPIPTYEALGLGHYNSNDSEAHKEEILKSRKRENDCYYIVDTAADLDRKWPLILQGRPDFIKVFLLHSENYAQRKAKQGYGEGIDPKVLPQIVARAHASGLTVSAHVDSASDYRTALKAGVDEMAHLSGYYVTLGEDILTYALSPEDARETARRGVHVTPTASLADTMEKPEEKQKTRTNQIRNLKLLKDAGVQFGIGTDSYGTDSLREALCLSRMGVWDNLEMLKMWCETTPRAIFRKRKIGYLHDGYEASFLVLDKSPLDRFENVQTIRMRFKQGSWISIP